MAVPDSSAHGLTSGAKRHRFTSGSKRLRWALSLLVLVLLTSLWLTRAVSSEPGGTGWLAWGMDRLFPALRIQFGEVTWRGASWVRLEDLRVAERSSGRDVLQVKALEIGFPWRGLLSRRVEEILLEEPVLLVSPEFFTALLGEGEGSEADTATGNNGTAWSQWTVGRLRCDFGEMRVQEVTAAPLFFSARFAFDWKEFGAAGEAAQATHRLVAWDVQGARQTDLQGPFFLLEVVEAEFSPEELLGQGVVRSVRLNGGMVRAGWELKSLLPGVKATGSPETAVVPSKVGQAQGWTLKALTVEGLRVALSGDFPGLGPGFEFTLNTALHDLPVGGLPEKLSQVEQHVELAHIELLSPLDPMIRVVTLHSLFAYFTLQGLLESRVDRLVVLNPTIYLSQDLFYYMQEMRPKEGNREEEAGEAEASDLTDSTDSADSAPQGEERNEDQDFGFGAVAPGDWVIGELEVKFGRLVLGGERIGQVGLPMSFQTTARDVAFADLASLRLETILQVDPQNYAFPDYQVDLENLRGELRFAYPPEEAPSNLVNQLFLGQLRWRQFAAEDLWLAATFDSTGIYAQLGGQAYGGYVSAGLSFTFGGASRWMGWVAGTGVDLQLLTDVLTPRYFQLKGQADFTVEVDAAGPHIARLKGELRAQDPGTMHVPRLDEVIDRLPDDWGLLKRSGTETALGVLRDYRYDSGKIDFWFVEGQGKLHASFVGPEGARQVELYVHGDDSAEGRWKQGKPQ